VSSLTQVVLCNQHAHATAGVTISVAQEGDVEGLLIITPFVHHKGIVDGYAKGAALLERRYSVIQSMG
jgi:hypothetical protein